MCDFEPPQLWNSKIVRTRKPHRCRECGAMIPEKTLAQKVDGLWDGSFSTLYLCEFCSELEWFLRIKGFSECRVYGDLRETIFGLIDSEQENYRRGQSCLAFAPELPWLVIDQGHFKLHPEYK